MDVNQDHKNIPGIGGLRNRVLCSVGFARSFEIRTFGLIMLQQGQLDSRHMPAKVLGMAPEADIAFASMVAGPFC